MSAKHAEISKSNESSKKKKTNKRKWRTISVNEDDILSFEEGGLISIEELTDYSILDARNAEPNSSSEPKVKKKKKNGKQDITNPTTKLSPSKQASEAESPVVKKVKKQKKKRTKKKKNVKKTECDKEIEAAEEDSNLQNNNPIDSDESYEFKAGDGSVSGSLSKTPVMEKEYKISCDMSDWKGLGVPVPLLASLADKGFTQPTPIQAATLPVAIFHHQDIIGAAETGSGKTLAFSLPILTRILDIQERRAAKNMGTEHTDSEEKPLYALILTPTRELALQIHKHIEEVTKHVSIRCAAVVGGLSEQKQERILGKCPEIVIGTPGRLLDMIKEGKAHLNKISNIKFLVIDEVDRMLQLGHFKEVSEILSRLSQTESKRQTFLFSATLTLPQFHKKWSSKKGDKKEKESIQMLVDKVTVNAKAKIIDLSSQHIAAEQIEQRRIICTDEEKDLYLLYVLLCHKGRTLVFVNSINCTRKICNFLLILGKNPLQLHAGKQQRQRLKALDRFVASDDSVMVATDVAARGLDIPDVDLVIHYHLPKDPKIYIHRSGRTARAKKGGMSVILEGPRDFREYRKLYDIMKLNKDLPSMDINASLLPDIQKRIQLARRIDKEEHQERKKNSDKSWFKKAAMALDIEIDDEETSDNERAMRKKGSNVKALRKELTQLLQLPLVPKGFSGNYITRTGTLKTIGI